jgi:hypothetical protein
VIEPFPCCGALPAIDPDHGVECCYECGAHRDDCSCPSCEVSRAADEDADMARGMIEP